MEKLDNETKEQIRAERTAMDLFLIIGSERGRNLNDQSDDLSGQKDREYGIKDLLPWNICERQQQDNEIRNQIYPLDLQRGLMGYGQRKRIVPAGGGSDPYTESGADPHEQGSGNSGEKRMLPDVRPERIERLEDCIKKRKTGTGY